MSLRLKEFELINTYIDILNKKKTYWKKSVKFMAKNSLIIVFLFDFVLLWDTIIRGGGEFY